MDERKKKKTCSISNFKINRLHILRLCVKSINAFLLG